MIAQDVLSVWPTPLALGDTIGDGVQIEDYRFDLYSSYGAFELKI